MFYPNNIEEKIDFTVIREELGRRCTSGLGRERVEAMQMETEYAKVQAMLMLTDQMRMAHEDARVSMPRGEIYDLRESVARIRIEGLFMDEAELDELRKSLSFAVEIETCFNAMDETRYGSLKGLTVSGLGVSGLGVVGNCHKMPEKWFRRRRLTVEEIVEAWQPVLAQ